MNAARLWRRGDGTVLSGVDLSQAVPMLRDELHDIAWLLDLLEGWLRVDEQGCDLLTDWLRQLGGHPTRVLSARGVIDELGRSSVTLHHILRAPDTGHPHPPTR